MKILFVNPHPDDTEVVCAAACKYAVDHNWEVHEILMTSDEYGVSDNRFKGKRIRRIRIHEMERAAKLYGTNLDGTRKIILHWFGEIDGYLPFNKDVFNRLKFFILKLEPSIIFAPDSFFSMDFHPDHLCTGWLVYFIIKSIEMQSRPLLLLYHSFHPNYNVPIQSLNFQINAWSQHRSQTTPIFNKLFKFFLTFLYNFRRIESGIKAEGYRIVRFKPKENELKSPIQKFGYYFFARIMKGQPESLYMPTPKELGLLN